MDFWDRNHLPFISRNMQIISIFSEVVLLFKIILWTNVINLLLIIIKKVSNFCIIT